MKVRLSIIFSIIIVVLVLGIVSISNAQQPFDRLCKGENQQLPILQDCRSSHYQRFLEESNSIAEKLIEEKAQKLKETADSLDIYQLEKLSDDAHSAWKEYHEKMMLYQTQIMGIKQIDSPKDCLISKFRYNLLKSYLSYLDSELKFLCQILQQRQNQ